MEKKIKRPDREVLKQVFYTFVNKIRWFVTKFEIYNFFFLKKMLFILLICFVSTIQAQGGGK
jgi:hypothetical protein